MIILWSVKWLSMSNKPVNRNFVSQIEMITMDEFDKHYHKKYLSNTSDTTYSNFMTIEDVHFLVNRKLSFSSYNSQFVAIEGRYVFCNIFFSIHNSQFIIIGTCILFFLNISSFFSICYSIFKDREISFYLTYTYFFLCYRAVNT